MKKKLLKLPVIAGLATALGLVSCTYDPYYGSVSGSYSSGYGYGYGYGGSGFSTSLFVSTGDSRWGYDPYNYCYYDYRSRRYYDPYLYGYYPVGYRPPVLVGVPHPHGWRPGRSYCPPPRVVRDVTVVNYRDRASAYHKIDQSWARNVRMKDYSHGRDSYRGHDSRRDSHGPSSHGRESGPSSMWNRNWLNPDSGRDSNRSNRDARMPSRYNTPVTREENIRTRDYRNSNDRSGFDRVNRMPQPSSQMNRREIREAPPVQYRNSTRRPEGYTPAPAAPQRSSGFRGRERNVEPPPQYRPEPKPQARPEESGRGDSRVKGFRGLRSLGDG